MFDGQSITYQIYLRSPILDIIFKLCFFKKIDILAMNIQFFRKYIYMY